MAEELIAVSPFREAGYRRLMEAHIVAGNRAEALRVYEQCRQLLAEELGAYPSPETDSIYRALLETPQTSVPTTPAAEPTVEPGKSELSRVPDWSATDSPAAELARTQVRPSARRPASLERTSAVSPGVHGRDRVCLRQRIRAELLREKLPLLVSASARFPATMCASIRRRYPASRNRETPISSSAHLPPPARRPNAGTHRQGRSTRARGYRQGRVALLDPRSVFPGQERPRASDSANAAAARAWSSSPAASASSASCASLAAANRSTHVPSGRSSR